MLVIVGTLHIEVSCPAYCFNNFAVFHTLNPLSPRESASLCWLADQRVSPNLISHSILEFWSSDHLHMQKTHHIMSIHRPSS